MARSSLHTATSAEIATKTNSIDGVRAALLDSIALEILCMSGIMPKIVNVKESSHIAVVQRFR